MYFPRAYNYYRHLSDRGREREREGERDRETETERQRESLRIEKCFL